MRTITRGVRRVRDDILTGKNIELYAVSTLAIILVILGVIDNVITTDIKVTAILAAVALLVFKATEPEKDAADLDSILLDRQSYGPFRDFIKGGHEVCIYGPSAVNVLANAPDIEREILNKGGKLRVIVQDPNEPASLELLHMQLDKMSHLLETDITRSLSILKSLQAQGDKVDFRLLKFNTGFSMVVVDPNGKEGRVIVEFYGFSNTLITDRMHIEIHRDQSQYWFEYWAKQFENMWQAAHEPEKTPDVQVSP